MAIESIMEPALGTTASMPISWEQEIGMLAVVPKLVPSVLDSHRYLGSKGWPAMTTLGR